MSDLKHNLDQLQADLEDYSKKSQKLDDENLSLGGNLKPMNLN
jgi:hypothetical protein